MNEYALINKLKLREGEREREKVWRGVFLFHRPSLNQNPSCFTFNLILDHLFESLCKIYSSFLSCFVANTLSFLFIYFPSLTSFHTHFVRWSCCNVERGREWGSYGKNVCATLSMSTSIPKESFSSSAKVMEKMRPFHPSLEFTFLSYPSIHSYLFISSLHS